MATIACPGCGLPREESEVGATPCPVCASAPALPVAVPPPGRARKKPAADPTDGLPADVSELNAPGASFPARASERGSRAPLVAATFLVGALCGVGGVLGFQKIDWPKGDEPPEVAAAPKTDAPSGSVSLPLAPMPHEPVPKPLAFGPGPGDDPEAKANPLPGRAPNADPNLEPDAKVVPPAPPGRVTTHEINEPDNIYSVPVMKKGEHIVLKGKVKTLRVHGLDAGAILNASGLEASVITVTGKIDNRSKLVLNAPGGTVNLSAKVDARSIVEITAPGGEVRFTAQTTPTREGSKIDNGSTVAITARTIEFKGDITGAETKVSLILTRNAWLKVASINGQALVEYKSQVAGWSPPDVIVGPVAATATFRKIE
jgi:hypothetical protein